jgi:hypothetical protein
MKWWPFKSKIDKSKPYRMYMSEDKKYGALTDHELIMFAWYEYRHDQWIMRKEPKPIRDTLFSVGFNGLLQYIEGVDDKDLFAIML